MNQVHILTLYIYFNFQQTCLPIFHPIFELDRLHLHHLPPAPGVVAWLLHLSNPSPHHTWNIGLVSQLALNLQVHLAPVVFLSSTSFNRSLGLWSSIWSVFIHSVLLVIVCFVYLKPPQGWKHTKHQTDDFFNPSSLGQSAVDQMNSATSNLV